MEIIPSILATTPEEFRERLTKIKPFTDRVHLDIDDGVFVKNKTILGYEELLKVDGSMKFEVHLMVQQPGSEMHHWFATAADRFIVHVETNHVLHQLIETVKLNNRSIGLALNPETFTDRLDEFLEEIDFVHFMTVDPGFYGSPFKESVVGKIAAFHEEHPDVVISVDGHITPSIAERLAIAGATRLIVGTYIFEAADPGKAIQNLQNFSSD